MARGAPQRELLSLSAYARRIGVSQQYLSKLKKAGRLPMVGDKVDAAAADALRAGSADPAKQVARMPTARALAAAGGVVLPPGAVELPSGFQTPVQRATAEDRQLSAEIKRAKLALLTGEQVDRAGVMRAISAHTEAAVRLARTLPDRVAPRVAAESDPRRCHAILVAEIDELMRAIAGDAGRAIAELDAGR